MNFEFSESISEAVSAMSRQDKQALSTYEEFARLVDGHYQIAIPWKRHSRGNPSRSLTEKVEVGRCYPGRLFTSNSAVARFVASYRTIFSTAGLQA